MVVHHTPPGMIDGLVKFAGGERHMSTAAGLWALDGYLPGSGIIITACWYLISKYLPVPLVLDS